jgi:hypothetical protein
MPSLTIVAAVEPGSDISEQFLAVASQSGADVLIARPTTVVSNTRYRQVQADLATTAGLARLTEAVKTDFFLLVLPGGTINFGSSSSCPRIPALGEDTQIAAGPIARWVQVAEDTGAGLVYSDFRDQIGDETSEHPLIDYQPGSIRDTFDFGGVVLISRQALAAAAAMPFNLDALKYGAFYDLRLRLSVVSALLRIPEPLYTRTRLDLRDSGKRQFDYVDPSGRPYQVEMEQIATNHLKRIGACLEPSFDSLPSAEQEFPVRASIVIPVRNRVKTIGDAVKSAVSQRTDFSFNVVVVDNHSTDGTTELLRDLAGRHTNLIHLVPKPTGLGIGGCWNEAIYSPHCGKFAVQLDSDDIYADANALARISARFDEGPFAMVIGSYTITDFQLNEIPPGLIHHREWTRENGRNNALRINGLGAPRGFYVPVLRQIGFPNTSYGEDYAVGLRISRDYEIGRIYESLYYARRWEGNSDAGLDLFTQNRFDLYKDRLRTIEIAARQAKNHR